MPTQVPGEEEGAGPSAMPVQVRDTLTECPTNVPLHLKRCWESIAVWACM